MSALQWFVIRLRPTGRLMPRKDRKLFDPDDRLEFDVRYVLNRREHQAMVPFEEKSVRQRGKWLTRKYPFFPCYIFGAFASHEAFIRERAYINKMAEGMGKPPPILNACGFGNRPSTLSGEQVEKFRLLSIERPTEVNLHKAIKIGSDVHILPGHWAAGRTVTVDAITRKGIKAQLELFMRMQEVEVAGEFVVAA